METIKLITRIDDLEIEKVNEAQFKIKFGNTEALITTTKYDSTFYLLHILDIKLRRPMFLGVHNPLLGGTIDWYNMVTDVSKSLTPEETKIHNQCLQVAIEICKRQLK